MIHELKPYPAYKESGVPWLDEVPIQWEMKRNGRLLAERKETGFPTLPILEVSLKTGVRVRDFDSSQRKQVMSERGDYKRAAQGDIAYNMMRMWQGAVGVAPVDGLVSPAYVVARPLPGTVTRYLAYLFRTAAYMREVDNYSRGIVSDRNRLYWDEFKQIPTPAPPQQEQTAIVRFLDHAERRIRRYIRAKQKVIQLLEEQKQAIICCAVTRGLDPNVRLKPSGVEWLGEVPEHWEVWQIGHFARVGNGSTPSRGDARYWTGGCYPWLNSSYANQDAVTAADQFVTDVAMRECHLPVVPPGSVLVAITGQGRTRGKATVLLMEATINQHIAFITPRPAVCSSGYLRMALSGAYAELRAMSDDSGSTKGALTCADLTHFHLALPPLREQASVVQAVHTATRICSSTIERIARQLSFLSEYRTRLIADVVTGKLDVRASAASFADEVDEQGALDETDTLAEAEEYAADGDLDAPPEEAEA